MTNEQLALNVQQGDTSSVGPLWEQVKLLTFQYAGRFLQRSLETCGRCGVTLDDLQQECFLAVMDGAKAYNQGSGLKFTSYLNFPIKNHFNALIGYRGNQRKEPINKAASLSEPLPGVDDPDITLQDVLEDTDIDIPADTEETEVQRIVRIAIKRIEPFSQYLIERYYFQDKTFDFIAQESGMERNEIRKRHGKALNELRETKEIQELAPFYVSHPESRYYSQDPLDAFLWGV